MIITVPRAQADAILGAMLQIALAHGAPGVTGADRLTIDAAARIVLGVDAPSADLPPCPPRALRRTVHGEAQAARVVRMLAVMALVDGRVDAEKVALVQEYAAALGVHEGYLGLLTEAVEGEIAQAAACMVRKNVASFPLIDPTGIDADLTAPYLPYRDGHEDPGLEARYSALRDLADGTFGRAFHDHFQRNGFAFPGNPNGLSEGFTTPHDSSHVLSGYSTSPAGEVLVSTFIGAMHPDHPMAAEVLPVLFSWHLGIELIPLAGSTTGSYHPASFWTAWQRGSATTVDVLDPAWDFWRAVETPLEELRRAHGVAPVDPALLS